MDPARATTPPFPSSSYSPAVPLDHQLRSMSLEAGIGASGGGPRPGGGAGAGLLQDEDMSLALLGAEDDSFEFREAGAGGEEDETARIPVQATPGGGSRAPGGGGGGGRDDLFFGGSMAASSSASASAPPSSLAYAPAVSVTPRARTPHAEQDFDDDGDELDLEGCSEEDANRIKGLREERDGLRAMNAALEGVLGALKGTEGKMEAFESTLQTSHALLDLYTRIASQAEHTKDLLLDVEWQGVMQDYDLLSQREQEAAERARQEREEVERRAREEREAEERAAREEEARERSRREAEERKTRGGAAAGRGRGEAGVSLSRTARHPYTRPHLGRFHLLVFHARHFPPPFLLLLLLYLDRDIGYSSARERDCDGREGPAGAEESGMG
ncbi:hypothetical protein JCM1841_006957 [Sporobolomyces salmonicolor]